MRQQKSPVMVRQHKSPAIATACFQTNYRHMLATTNRSSLCCVAQPGHRHILLPSPAIARSCCSARSSSHIVSSPVIATSCFPTLPPPHRLYGTHRCHNLLRTHRVDTTLPTRSSPRLLFQLGHRHALFANPIVATTSFFNPGIVTSLLNRTIATTCCANPLVATY